MLSLYDVIIRSEGCQVSLVNWFKFKTSAQITTEMIGNKAKSTRQKNMT